MSVSDFSHLSVLVVDDSPSLRAILVKHLGELQIKTSEAGNGVEALTLLRDKNYDLLFTDLVMPEMDGFELCEEIRKLPRHLHMPIVAVSTFRDSHYITRALRQGADDFLSKPVVPSKLNEIISRVTSHLPEVS